MVPRLVIAAPSSGSGKTTVATGLLAALHRSGHTVAPFKIGPDYIDPGYHTAAAARIGRNLDPMLVGEERIGSLFAHGAAGADVAVIEGVMGMFDGNAADSDFGSTAHVAKLLSAPVLLVVDAWGQARSMAAVVQGFRDFDPEVRLAGVIANRVGSVLHRQILAEACAQAGLPMLGALPRDRAIDLPSRHLGLVTVPEMGTEAGDAIDAMAALVAEHVDLDAVLGIARAARDLTVPPWNPAEHVPAVPGHPVIAVAGGSAFTFGYAEHRELLEAAGAAVAVFDPLRSERLPAGTVGVVLPGGFPEQHAEILSANVPLRRAIREFSRSGGVVHAECGGLLYLAATLDGSPMCGALEVDAVMSDRLRLGYRDAVAATTSILGPEGAARTGHEFHHTLVRSRGGTRPAWRWCDDQGNTEVEGFVRAGVHASYLHLHPAGNPDLVASFVRNCVADSSP